MEIIQSGGRFIQDNDLGLYSQYRGYGYSLPFPLGECKRELLFITLQLNDFQGLGHPLPDCFGVHTQDLRTKADFLFNRFGEDLMIRILKNVSHFLSQILMAESRGWFSPNQHAASSGLY